LVGLMVCLLAAPRVATMAGWWAGLKGWLSAGRLDCKWAEWRDVSMAVWKGWMWADTMGDRRVASSVGRMD